jgi:hypothetical protein
MIYPSQAIQIRPDLKEYRELCSKFGHQPTKEEYEETLKFLLLFHTGIGHTCESREVDFFYEDMEMHLLENNLNQDLFESTFLNEEGGAFADAAKEKDTALGLISGAGMAAGGLALAGAVGAGILIQYLFKKGKVKGAAQAELAATMKKLEPYQELYNAKKELAALKGEEFTGLSDLPTIPQPPAMAEVKEKE